MQNFFVQFHKITDTNSTFLTILHGFAIFLLYILDKCRNKPYNHDKGLWKTRFFHWESERGESGGLCLRLITEIKTMK